MSRQKIQGCELCPGIARMYCESDEARLCFDCDAKVHSANFLVARHRRTLLCRSCQGLTPWKAEGARLGPTMSVCQRCLHGKKMNVSDDHQKLKAGDEEEEDYEEEEESEQDEEEEEGGGEEEQVVPGVEEGESPDVISSSCCSSNEEKEDDDEENEEETVEKDGKSKMMRQNALFDLFSSSQDEHPNSPLLKRKALLEKIQIDDEDKDTSKLLRPLKLQKKSDECISSSRQLAMDCPPI